MAAGFAYDACAGTVVPSRLWMCEVPFCNPSNETNRSCAEFSRYFREMLEGHPEDMRKRLISRVCGEMSPLALARWS